MDPEEVKHIISEVDYFGNQKINYSEFLMATLNTREFLDDTKLRALFSQFDTDGSGVITQKNIVAAMTKMGHEINQGEID